jgi:hypothetical protein
VAFAAISHTKHRHLHLVSISHTHHRTFQSNHAYEVAHGPTRFPPKRSGEIRTAAANVMRDLGKANRLATVTLDIAQGALDITRQLPS